MQISDAAVIHGVSPDERRVIETFYRSFNDQRPALLDTVCWPDWQDVPLAPGQGAGPDGLKPLIVAFCAAFPDLRITIREMIGATGHVAVRAELSATHQGSWFGIAPTGRKISMVLHEFHHLRDGKLSHTWHLEDWFGFLHQVGAWPLAGGPNAAQVAS